MYIYKHTYIHIHVHIYKGQPDRHGSSKIDFAHVKRAPATGHVIAARITAENPDAGFRPTSGVLLSLRFLNLSLC